MNGRWDYGKDMRTKGQDPSPRSVETGLMERRAKDWSRRWVIEKRREVGGWVQLRFGRVGRAEPRVSAAARPRKGAYVRDPLQKLSPLDESHDLFIPQPELRRPIFWVMQICLGSSSWSAVSGDSGSSGYIRPHLQESPREVDGQTGITFGRCTTLVKLHFVRPCKFPHPAKCCLAGRDTVWRSTLQ